MNIKYRINKRKRALSILNKIQENQNKTLIIHYSCESFYNIKNGRSPRITSIAIRFFETGQTVSFSIHQIAEKEKVDFESIENKYDLLEKLMLDDYFNFIETHQNYTWVHWNMRDSNYGFEALKNRYIVLGGTPQIISDNDKIDLSSKIIDIYSPKYMNHPRLENLLRKNGISTRNFLSGKDESECFNNKDFVKLHQSTLRKVDVFNSIIDRVLNDELNTKSNLKDIYGFSFQSIYACINEYWWAQIIYSLFFIVIGIFIEKLILLE